MSDLTEAAANLAYNTLIGDGVAIALFTDDGEVDVNGYSRQSVPFSEPEEGRGTNTTPVTFGPLAGEGVVTDVALYGTGQITKRKRLERPASWGEGGLIRFQEGDIVFAL